MPSGHARSGYKLAGFPCQAETGRARGSAVQAAARDNVVRIGRTTLACLKRQAVRPRPGRRVKPIANSDP